MTCVNNGYIRYRVRCLGRQMVVSKTRRSNEFRVSCLPTEGLGLSVPQGGDGGGSYWTQGGKYRDA